MFNYQPEPDIPFPWNPDPDDDEEDDWINNFYLNNHLFFIPHLYMFFFSLFSVLFSFLLC
jgi:hypothetical protein